MRLTHNDKVGLGCAAAIAIIFLLVVLIVSAASAQVPGSCGPRDTLLAQVAKAKMKPVWGGDDGIGQTIIYVEPKTNKYLVIGFPHQRTEVACILTGGDNSTLKPVPPKAGRPA